MEAVIEIGVLLIEGDEAMKYLQSIVSSDVEQLNIGDTGGSLLLEPTGKVVSPMYIYRKSEQAFLILVNKDAGEIVFANLKRFLIRTKATLSDVSEQYCARVTTDETDSIISSYIDDDGLYVQLVDRQQPSGLKEYEELRIANGTVSYHETIGIIPQEAHLDKFGVSFTKGCYLGQELVCRIDSRGAQTPFEFFSFDTEEEVLVNDSLFIGEVNVGEITSVSNKNVIGKISRKGRTLLEENPHDIHVLSADKSVLITNLTPVQGAFAL